MGGIPRGSKRHEDDKFLHGVEVAALLHAARDVLHDRRLFYLLGLQYLLALRVGEVTLLEWGHIGPLNKAGEPEYVRVPTLKKGGDEMPLLIVPVLSHHAFVRSAFDKARLDPRERQARSRFLFASRDGRSPLTTTHASRLFKKAAMAAGIHRDVSTHALRRTANTALFRKCRDYEVCRRFLRHEGQSVTARYVRHEDATNWAEYRGALDLPPIAPLGTPARA